MNADDLLRKVHERLVGGVDIQTFSNGAVEIRWRRLYDGEILSDERYASADSLSSVLIAVLAYEDEADRHDADEARGESDSTGLPAMTLHEARQIRAYARVSRDRVSAPDRFIVVHGTSGWFLQAAVRAAELDRKLQHVNALHSGREVVVLTFDQIEQLVEECGG